MRKSGKKAKFTSVQIHLLGILRYLFLYILLWYLCVFYSGYTLFLILSFMTLFPFLSLGMSFRLKKRLQLRFNFEKECDQESIRRSEKDVGKTEPDRGMEQGGNKVEMSLYLKNLTWAVSLYTTIELELENSFYGTKLAQSVVVTVGPRREEKIRLPVRSLWCGFLRVTAIQTQVKDLLGWVTWSNLPQASAELVLLPNEQEEQTSLSLTGMEAEEDCAIPGQNMSDVIGIREYHSGDRIRDIHWKYSAGKEELFVKERSASADEVVNLVLALDGEPALVDTMLRKAYGICINATNLNIPVRMIWWCGGQEALLQEVIDSRSEVDKGFGKMFAGGRKIPEGDLRQHMNQFFPQISNYLYFEPGRGPVLVESNG